MQHNSAYGSRASEALGWKSVPPPWVSNAILLAIALQAVIKCAAGLGLYGDGSYFLLRVLQDQEVSTYDWHRGLAQVVMQGPLVLAVHAGLTRMNVLVYLHSICLIAIPAALWMMSLQRLRTSPVFCSFLAVFAIAHFNSSLFAIGEYNLAFAITGLAFAILVQPGKLSARDGLTLVACCLVSTRCHESFVFLGVLLVGLAAWRANLMWSASRTHPGAGLPGKGEAAWLGAAVVLLSCSVVLSGWSIAFPRDPGNLAAATDFLGQLRNPQLAISLAVGALYGVQLMAIRNVSKASQVVAAGGLAAGCLLSLGIPVPEFWSVPHQYYGNRTLCGLVVLGGFSAIAIWHFGGAHPAEYGHGNPTNASTLPRLLPVLLFTMLLVPTLVHTRGFYNYLDRFQSELESGNAYVRVDSTSLRDDKIGIYGWTWTNPSLSLLLREDEEQAIVLNAEDVAWEPFDVDKDWPEIMRRIRHYHFNASALFRW